MNLNKLICKIGALVLFTLPLASNATIITVDNLDAGFSSEGFRKSSSVGTSYKSGYMVDVAGSNGDYAIWNPSDTLGWDEGIWQVEMSWSAFSNRATSALVTIGTGLETLFINQTISSGSWQNLGSFAFSTTGSFVKIDDSNSTAGQYVVADAVRFTYLAALPEPASVSAPATILTLGLSLFGLALVSRKKFTK